LLWCVLAARLCVFPFRTGFLEVLRHKEWVHDVSEAM
jgi:hypothetical protein